MQPTTNVEETRKKLVAAQTHRIMMLSSERDQALVEREDALVERDIAKQETRGIAKIMLTLSRERDQLGSDLDAARLRIKHLEAQIGSCRARAPVRR